MVLAMTALHPLAWAQEVPVEAPAPAQNGLVFVELFSAESCPFCPQAERNFADFMQDPDVIGFTCMVHYFESGEHNRYAKPFCTTEQDLYRRMMRSGSLYTPQLVINGQAEMPGQDLQGVIAAIRAVRASATQPVRVDIRPGSDAGSFDVLLPAMTPKEDGERFVLRMIGLQTAPPATAVQSSVIGRSQPPVNLATALFEGGLWTGQKTVWTLKPSLVPGTDSVVVMIQDRSNGHVLGAGKMDIEPVAP